ncbi:aminoacyl-tRNA hydrolase [Alphaproteobacteria bacterium]|nr:aminoacyl-tRNA hydrolase [Alphaproteobacteria bacterium]
MLLLVGLGNPGQDYAGNRHNIGFMVVDEIVRRYGLPTPRSKSRPHGMLSEGPIDGEKVIVLKPLTYMNESGRAIGSTMRYYKLEPTDVFVFHDELDLAAGKVRAKFGGGNAGHNGLRSIDAHIGRDYWRVRLGIGHPGDRNRVTGHVLKDFSKADRLWVENIVKAVADAVPLMIARKEADFMTRVALLTQPRTPKISASDKAKPEQENKT